MCTHWTSKIWWNERLIRGNTCTYRIYHMVQHIIQPCFPPPPLCSRIWILHFNFQIPTVWLVLQCHTIFIVMMWSVWLVFICIFLLSSWSYAKRLKLGRGKLPFFGQHCCYTAPHNSNRTQLKSIFYQAYYYSDTFKITLMQPKNFFVIFTLSRVFLRTLCRYLFNSPH